jgi:8-oxo-dGTP pyrophosphatase MutT (NUDIX family)
MNEPIIARNIIKSFKVEIKSAVGVVFDQSGNLLLGRSTDTDDRFGKWCFPGGGINPGESVLQAAIRETYEETGILCSPLRTLTVTHPVKPTVGFCVLSAKNTNIDFNEEYSEMQWFSYLPPDILQMNRDILELIKWQEKRNTEMCLVTR